MKTSIPGMMEIASHEGIVQMPYRDSVGVWTWGIGHTAAAGAPDPARMAKGRAAPLKEVLKTFRRDLTKYESEVAAAVTVPLAQHQFDALVSFHYNTGAVGRASFVKKLNAGDVAGAAEGMMDWRKPPEIIPRRRREQALFRDGTYSSGGFANVYPADAQGQVQWSKGKRMSLDGLFDSEDGPPGLAGASPRAGLRPDPGGSPGGRPSTPPPGSGRRPARGQASAASPDRGPGTGSQDDPSRRAPAASPDRGPGTGSQDEGPTSKPPPECAPATPAKEHWLLGLLKLLFGRT